MRWKLTDLPPPDKAPRARASEARTHPPHNGPAKGPGRGGPASGIPAKGAGWWGPGARLTGAVRAQQSAFGRRNVGGPRCGQDGGRGGAQSCSPMRSKSGESVMSDPDAPPQARVIAADKMVERAEGRPVQPVVSLDAELGAPIDLDALADDERAVMERVILRLVHKAAASTGKAGPTIEGAADDDAD